MAVIVVPKFTKAEIKKFLENRKRQLERAIQFNLQRIGEEFVKNCRDNDTYKDRTGNLRSSIGYVILHNGKQIKRNFKIIEGPDGDGKEGSREAKKLISAVMKDFPVGWVLIGVAGMDYAAAVEAKGYDVISNGAIQAENDLKAAVRRIKTKIQ